MQLLLVKHISEKKKKKLASLKGKLKDVKITDEEIEDSKKSLFKI